MENVPLKAILVDDEQRARDVLSNLLSRFAPEIEVLTTCANIPEAIESIKLLNPDVVFLDIEMPMYAGFEIVSFFEHIPFQIVFVTAYDRYAIKAFEVSAVDYLLKPVEIDRLKKTVSRLQKQRQANVSVGQYEALKDNLKNSQALKLVIRHNGMRKVLEVDHIFAFEAQESYCKIHTKEGVYMMSKNLKHFENIMSGNLKFFRSHKSWLVNLSEVERYSKKEMHIELGLGLIAKLSKYKLTDFEQRMLE